MIYPPNREFPRQRVIAVDFDGTLFRKEGCLNEGVAAWCRKKKSEGFQMILWSARGREICERAVVAFGLVGVFDHVLSKPGYILDDKGWSWIKYTHVVKPSDQI